jgi:hypothetical protein
MQTKTTENQQIGEINPIFRGNGGIKKWRKLQKRIKRRMEV